MRKMKCIGYGDHPCHKDYFIGSNGQKRCSSCAKEAKKISQKAWDNSHRELIKGYVKKWCDTHRELITVKSHHTLIFKSRDKRRIGYKNMPFFDKWNPLKGGSFHAAEKWIIKNIGRRPEGTSLHIIDHIKGFVPGNLEWTHPKKQNNQQMYKIIAQLRHRIRELETKNTKLKKNCT